MKILIDNGHGVDTKGKRSPDGQLREYSWTRRCASLLEDALTERGYDAQCIVPEDIDISLSERCKRVNSICKRVGAKNVILVSIHCNAAGADGQWHSARGWEAWTSIGTTAADRLATCLYKAAKKAGLKIREDMSDGDPDKEGHLYILKHSLCPAVLTENLFQDNKEDVEYLMSDKGIKEIVNIHVNGIVNYIKNKSV